MKRENINEHPKKPHPTTVDDLTKTSYWDEKDHAARMLKNKIYRPEDDGKLDF